MLNNIAVLVIIEAHNTWSVNGLAENWDGLKAATSIMHMQ